MEDSNYWTRLASRRVSRRALLGGSATAALGGAAAMVVGCGGGDDGGGGNDGPTRTPYTGPPTSGGTITWGWPVQVLGIDPHLDLTGLFFDTLLYTYLYSWIPGTEEIIFNGLAETLEQPEPVDFIFTLRPGVLNAPFDAPGAGEELTSADVKATFLRRGTAISAIDKRFPHKIAGGTTLDSLESALLTPDPRTFRFTMAEPFVPGVREMANPTWAIVSEKVLDEYRGKGLSQVAFGSGPFMLEEFRGNERIVLTRNPNYYVKDRPYLDGITYVIITEGSSLLSAFKNEQHDVNGSILTQDDYVDFQDDPDIAVGRAPSLFYPVVHLKVGRAPFDQVRVREAMNISINRDLIIELTQGGEGEYNGPIQWPQFKWALPQEELRPFYAYDPARARELLAEAGYPNGFQTRMKLPRLEGASFINDTAIVLRDSWKEVGIDVQLDEIELGAFIGSTLLPGNFDLAFFPNLPYDEPDRPLSFYHSLGVTGAGNWNNYSNPDLDALIDAQAQEFDEEARKEIINEAQRLILNEHGPQLTLTGGYQYSARWSGVHFPYELGDDPPEASNPFGADIWTEKV